jgi:ribonuclease HI
MPQEFFAVKVGRQPGIYYNWADCAAQITGFSNASFKKFDSISRARQFLGEAPSIRTLIAYIGGSRIDDTLGVGVHFYDPDTDELAIGIGTFSVSTCRKIAKWAPYFVGCYFAIRQAIMEKYQQLIICTNEPDLKHWARKDYGPYTYMSSRFKDLINNSKSIEIIFANGYDYIEDLADSACALAEFSAIYQVNPMCNPLVSENRDLFAEEAKLLFP